MSIDRKSLGALIRTKREELGLKQIDLSEGTGISRTYISDVENGRYMPSINTLAKIAVVIELDLNILKMTEIQTE